MKKLKDYFSSFGFVRKARDDEKGTAAMMLGVAMVPLTMAVGVAVDHGNQVEVLSKLQAATDAGVLAAGRDHNKKEQDLRAIADKFFHENFGTPANASGQKITLTKDKDCIFVTGEVKVKNLFMKLVDQEDNVIKANAKVCRATQGMELVMVFDNTGSMGDFNRLKTLKEASTHLTNILFGDKETSKTLKIGIVPFSQAVNVGAHNADKFWIDKAGKSPVSIKNFSSNQWHNWRAWEAIKNRDWNGCVEARQGNLAVSDVMPASNKGATLFTPLFAPDEPGDSKSKSKVDGDNYYNSYISDQQGKNWSAHQRQSNPQKYENASVNTTSRGPGAPCNVEPITPLTGTKQTILTALSKMRASGYTHIAEGVGWGTRVLSPTEPFTEGGPYNNPKIPKVMILLTDGENTFDSESNHNKSTYTAYGFLGQNRLGSSQYSKAVDKQNKLVEQGCDYAKKQGIIVYSFAYQVKDKTARNLIKNCASDPEKYFDPPTNSQLIKYFEQIADELRGLYLAQ